MPNSPVIRLEVMRSAVCSAFSYSELIPGLGTLGLHLLLPLFLSKLRK